MKKKKKKLYNFEEKQHIVLNQDLQYTHNYNDFIKKFTYISFNYRYKNNIEYLSPKKFISFFIDKNCVPFWNDNVAKMSAEIFLPNDENIEENKYLNFKFNKNKWFKSQFYNSKSETNKKISYISNIYENNKVIKKTRKIQFYPDKIQKSTLKELFGIYRYYYNRTIQFMNNYNSENKTSFYLIYINDNKSKKEFNDLPKNIYNMYKLRNYIKINEPKWINKIKLPSHEIDKAIKEAVDNIKTNFKKKEKTGKNFTMKFKTKKDIYHTINIEKQTISKSNTIFSGMKIDNKYIFKKGIRLKENISKYNYGDSNISCDIKSNKYFLNLSYDEENIERDINKYKTCGIDPGIKNFITIYDESSVANIGMRCENKMNKICKEIDIIKSHINKKKFINRDKELKMNANRRRNLRKALRRKEIYIKNIIDELHKQTIKYLTEKYTRIIISPFESQKLDKILSRRQTRILKCLSHYKFKERLITKAKENNIKIDIREEYYTSITCTKCGNINYDLGNNDIYKCTDVRCKISLGRDYNGARNILLRNINNI